MYYGAYRRSESPSATSIDWRLSGFIALPPKVLDALKIRIHPR
jgi:hypothetical protein